MRQILDWHRVFNTLFDVETRLVMLRPRLAMHLLLTLGDDADVKSQLHLRGAHRLTH